MTRDVTWFRKEIVVLLVFSMIALALFINLERLPPLWWDEGWTLSVARNWVELGHYGRLLDGQPYTAGLAGHFPVVALVALSFKLFGVGAWQARLPGALLTLAALGFLFFLANRLYNRQIAYGTLFLLLLANPGEPLHPIYMGRQVLGELPALFFLLGGYVCLLKALSKSGWWILPAMLFWGIAIRTKAQEPYFWLGSLLVPLSISLFKRWWKEALLLGSGLVGTWLLSSYSLAWLQTVLIAGHYISGQPLQGSFEVVVFVPILSVRWKALQSALAFCLPALLGIGLATWKSIRILQCKDSDPAAEIVRWALLVFSGGWFTWYLTLGIFWERYALQANFVGSIFGSALLYELTGGFDFRRVMKQVGTLLHLPHDSQLGLRTLLVQFGYFALVCWVVISVLFTILIQINWFWPLKLISVRQTADYLNSFTKGNERIETYESELFFYLNRRYHYPSDQVSMELARRDYIDPEATINYDPIQADPDYLVIGRQEEEWGLYAPWLDSGDFQLIQEFPGYQIYKRLRD